MWHCLAAKFPQLLVMAAQSCSSSLKSSQRELIKPFMLLSGCESTLWHNTAREYVLSNQQSRGGLTLRTRLLTRREYYSSS